MKESKGGCHQRQCQKKPPLPKTSTQVESQRVQGDQSQYNKVDTTKKPNQNVAEVQQSNEAPHVPKKLKRKPMCPPLSMDDFLGNVESDNEEIMMNEEVEQNEEDNNHHNEVEEENNGDITKGTSKKRTRGQTSCKNIHARSIEEREEVILNDDGQPIGPREKTVKDLSLFLGTMARNSTFCPLTYTNWKALPSDLKDHMWKYNSQLKDHLTQNPEQNHTEAFKEVFGKEKAGRVRCYGRNVTPTALKQKEKQNQIMVSMKQEHAKEVNPLKSELQDVKQQMLGMQSFIKVWMQQNNSGMNMENLDVFFRSFPSEANNAQNDEGQCNEHSTTHASDPNKVELLLLILNIPQYDFNLKVLARQEPLENPKQSRARDFPHLPPNQTLPLPRRRRLLLLRSPKALLRFLRQDLLQRDDAAERSEAMRRRRREICPVAMDPPSMVRVFAVDERV
ncbi:putative transposase [Senna tora]|uniref:Putative transposase n=1 Tax=Senna tora TaxID=362788 RepID=A0A834WUF1_9FABA|nr:putative transposase [Senna tora]